MSEKQYKTEWSFSFEKIGDTINNAISQFGTDEELKTSNFVAVKGNATSADVRLDFSMGKLNISSLGPSENLVEADVKHFGEMVFSVTGEEQKSVRLHQETGNPVMNKVKQAIGSISKRADLRWDVRLTPDLPINLQVNSGIGKAQLDLSDLKLTNLDFDGGTGETRVTLPASATPYDAEFNTGVGAITVDIPADTSINLSVDAGVGSVTVNLTGSTAVRVKVDSGIGDVNLPSHFQRVSGDRDFMGRSGVWETAGFNLADKKVVIEYDGGVGSFKVTSNVTMV